MSNLKKLAVSVAIGLALVTLSGLPARAAPVPKQAIGIWSLGDCGNPDLAVLANSTGALVVQTAREETFVAVVKAEWVAGSFVLTTEDANEELVLPPLNQFKRCEFLPPAVSVPFPEAVAIFKRLDEIEAACVGEETNFARCATVVLEVIDVTGDGLFSQSELSRGLRALGFFLGYRMALDVERETADAADPSRWPPMVPLSMVYVGQILGTALGPLVAGNLIQGYDYDGDGFLSFPEFMHDRIPETGLQGVIARTALEMSPGMLSVFMKSLGSVFDWLP